MLDNFFDEGFPQADNSGRSVLTRIVAEKREDADGLDVSDRMIVDCLAELTAHCLEVMNTDGAATKSTIGDLNARGSRSFETGTFAMAVDRLGDKYVLGWLDGACRDLWTRVREGDGSDVERMASVILTKVMAGDIASSVVRACGLPIKNVALDAAAGLHAILNTVGQPRLTELLKEYPERLAELTFDKATCLFVFRVLKLEDLLQLFKKEELQGALYNFQLYLVSGDRDLARHNLWVIESALGLHEVKEDATESANDSAEQPDYPGTSSGWSNRGHEEADDPDREPALV